MRWDAANVSDCPVCDSFCIRFLYLCGRIRIGHGLVGDYAWSDYRTALAVLVSVASTSSYPVGCFLSVFVTQPSSCARLVLSTVLLALPAKMTGRRHWNWLKGREHGR